MGLTFWSTLQYLRSGKCIAYGANTYQIFNGGGKVDNLLPLASFLRTMQNQSSIKALEKLLCPSWHRKCHMTQTTGILYQKSQGIDLRLYYARAAATSKILWAGKGVLHVYSEPKYLSNADPRHPSFCRASKRDVRLSSIDDSSLFDLCVALSRAVDTSSFTTGCQRLRKSCLGHKLSVIRKIWNDSKRT